LSPKHFLPEREVGVGHHWDLAVAPFAGALNPGPLTLSLVKLLGPDARLVPDANRSEITATLLEVHEEGGKPRATVEIKAKIKPTVAGARGVVALGPSSEYQETRTLKLWIDGSSSDRETEVSGSGSVAVQGPSDRELRFVHVSKE